MCADLAKYKKIDINVAYEKNIGIHRRKACCKQ